ncbi:MAG: hypothetical protein U0271_40945 [Polyangiaceae bacterium]
MKNFASSSRLSKGTSLSRLTVATTSERLVGLLVTLPALALPATVATLAALEGAVALLDTLRAEGLGASASQAAGSSAATVSVTATERAEVQRVRRMFVAGFNGSRGEKFSAP